MALMVLSIKNELLPYAVWNAPQINNGFVSSLGIECWMIWPVTVSMFYIFQFKIISLFDNSRIKFILNTFVN